MTIDTGHLLTMAVELAVLAVEVGLLELLIHHKLHVPHVWTWTKHVLGVA